MKTRALWMTAALGLGLLGATVLQALNARGMAPPPLVPPAPPARHVAAEGRVFAYPGAEVRVSAERGGRLVRLAVEERQRVGTCRHLGRGHDYLQIGSGKVPQILQVSRVIRRDDHHQPVVCKILHFRSRDPSFLDDDIHLRPIGAGKDIGRSALHDLLDELLRAGEVEGDIHVRVLGLKSVRYLSEGLR